MEITAGRLFVEVGELLADFNVPSDTIAKGLLRHRQNPSRESWVHIDHPEDSRKVLVQYATIPPNTRTKCCLPKEQDLIKRLTANRLAQKALSAKIAEQREENELFKSLKSAKNALYPQYFSLYYSAFGSDKALQYAQKHSLWLAVLRLKKPRRLENLHKAFRKVETSQYKSLQTFSHAIKKASELLAAGKFGEFVAHGNTGRRNAQKTTEFHEWAAEAWASIGKAYSTPYIKDRIIEAVRELNERNLEHGESRESLKEVSESWVKLYLRQPHVRERVHPSRFGQDRAFNLRPYVVREKALFADDQWQIDGWTLPFYNEGESNWERLTVCVVMDTYSGAWLGYSFDISENGAMIWRAVEQACRATGRLPYEIVSDNHSFNKTNEFRNLKQELENIGVHWTVTENPQYKSELERAFQTFSNEYCKPEDGFIGEGIKSRRRGAHPSPELRALSLKAEHRRDRSGVIRLMENLISLYNNTSYKGREPRMKRYENSEKPHTRTLALESQVFLFWKKTQLTIQRYYAVLTVSGQKYHYNLSSNELMQRWNGQLVTVRYESDLSKVFLFDPANDAPICELKQTLAIAGTKANQTEDTELAMFKRKAKHKSYSSHIKKQIEEKTKNVQKHYGESAPLELLNPKSAKKEMLHSAIDQYNRAEIEQTHNIRPDLVKVVKPINEALQTPYGKALEQPVKTKSSPGARPYSLKPIDLNAWEDDE